MNKQHTVFHDFPYAIDGIFNEVPPQTVYQLLCRGKQSKADFEAALSAIEPMNTDAFSPPVKTGPKSALLPNTVFLDRYRRLFHVCAVDGAQLHALPLHDTSGQAKIFLIDLDQYHEALSHEHPKHGIQIVATNPSGATLLLPKDGQMRITNRMINDAQAHLCVDLRTTTDLGDQKIPRYKHRLWQKDQLAQKVIFGTLSKKSYKGYCKKPTQGEIRAFQNLVRCVSVRGREVNDDEGEGELLGYWQTPEYLQGLLDLAHECDRILSLPTTDGDTHAARIDELEQLLSLHQTQYGHSERPFKVVESDDIQARLRELKRT